MNLTTAMALNDQGCFLLSQSCVSEALEVFKRALSALKKETQGRPTDSLLSNPPLKNLYHEDGTASCDFTCSLIVVPSSFQKQQQERYKIYSRPLSIQAVPSTSSSFVRCTASDAFTISYNVALASHLQGVEQAMEGECDAASHSLLVAQKLYNLTLQQANYKQDCGIANTRNDHIFAAIFNNLAHVHAMLGEGSHCLAYAQQLIKTLFYLLESGRVSSPQEVSAHKMFLENAHCLLMAPNVSAAAA